MMNGYVVAMIAIVAIGAVALFAVRLWLRRNARSSAEPNGAKEQSAQRSGSKTGSKVLVAIVVVSAVVVPVSINIVPEVLRESEYNDILEHGVTAKARIVDLVDTGNRSNYNPEVRIFLTVMPDDGEPFGATVTRYVSAVELAGHGPGSEVQVKYDPADRTRVALFPW